MKSEEGKEKGLSKSFVKGIIALVFLILGYQIAHFVHRAAVVKIAADRDSPDTVFVYCGDSSSGAVKSVPDNIVSSDSPLTRTRKVNSRHSERTEAVRRNLPRPVVESFNFNPNTVSVEDLCRLGFSPKQAQAIENYRIKGGRFRRKSDFADSYVVSDSVYKRLEPYITIPLTDLNEADSAAFDALPGIGGWYARKIIEHRKALGGYSDIEQLLDIYGFDREKFNALSDLVCVKAPYRFLLWTLPADSLRRHPYIRNYETANAIVLYRNNNPEELWTVANLQGAGIISEDVAMRLSRCVE